jgi:glycosyltransferase involved in cell wall biosynthesis
LAGETPIERIPFGTDLVGRDLGPGEPDGGLLFVGDFVHPPNVDAALRLATSIFPGITRSHPACVLYVIGNAPPRNLVAAAPPGVIVTGWVPEIETYLERAAIVVAPLRQGGGMRVKVLEALAAGKALVASPLAAEGLDVLDGVQLKLAESDLEFIQAITTLLDDDAERRTLAATASSWARRNLSWSASIEAFLNLYADLGARGQLDQADQEGPRPGSRSHSSAIHSP